MYGITSINFEILKILKNNYNKSCFEVHLNFYGNITNLGKKYGAYERRPIFF